MIKKLHWKFVLVNMIFIASILTFVLGTLYYSNMKRHEKESHFLMEQALERTPPDPGSNSGFSRRNHRAPPPPSPIFLILLDQDMQISKIVSNNISVSDETAAGLVSEVGALPDSEGVLKEFSIRYMKKDIPEGQKIVFLDQSYEINVMKSLAVNCVAIFCIGNILFFLLSLYLSRWALKPVETAWKQQNQFIADASHELKTPLTVILANLQILASHRTSTIESQEKWLKNTSEEAARMKQLVEELLFLARSDASSVKCSEINFDFSDAVLNCVLLFESVAFEQKVTLENTIEPGIHMIGDESQIKQLTGILLDNACKYAGREGAVQVKVHRTQNHILMSVHNTGDPIPEEDIAHIFERFYRSDKSRVRKEGGYGLGLAIAATIAERHKGKITFTSSAAQGTTFTVKFTQVPKSLSKET